MERRLFLQGLVTSVVGTSVGVELATPREVAAVVSGDKLAMTKLEEGPIPVPFFGDGKVYSRDSDGNYVMIGVMTELRVETQVMDVTSHWDGEVRLVPGLLRDPKLLFSGPF